MKNLKLNERRGKRIMAMSYLEAKTKVDGFVEIRNKQNVEVANIIKKTMIARCNQEPNKNVVRKEISKLLEDFPEADKVKILTELFILMC